MSEAESGASSIESAPPRPSPEDIRLIPESLGRDRLIPDMPGSAAVTSESLGLRSGVASNSSLPSRALNSKSLPVSGWSASMTLEGVSSKSLSESGCAGTSADEPTTGLWRIDVSPEVEDNVSWCPVSSAIKVTSESLGALFFSVSATRTSESLALLGLSGTSRTSESLGILPPCSIPMMTELEPEAGLGGSDRSSSKMS